MRLDVRPQTPEKFRWDWTLWSSSTLIARGPEQGFTTSEGAVKSVAKMLGGLYTPSARRIVRRGPAVQVIIHN